MDMHVNRINQTLTRNSFFVETSVQRIPCIQSLLKATNLQWPLLLSQQTMHTLTLLLTFVFWRFLFHQLS